MSGGWFIDVTALPADNHGFFQVLCLCAVYGYGLTYAATLISDGSELLLFIPSIAGLVGSVVLPVLGAVPDGMIVFFSGMGPQAQAKLSVGVGALAGSTIMLLTIPWFLSIVGGRVSMGNNGKPNYGNKSVASVMDIAQWSASGVKLTSDINRGAYLMIITCMPYLLLQVPGLMYENASLREVAAAEHSWAAFGFLSCLFLFCAYLYYSYKLSESNQNNSQILTREEVIKAGIEKGTISILGLMQSEREYAMKLQQQRMNSTAGSGDAKYGAVDTVDSGDEYRDRVSRLIKPFFHRYDTDRSGSLELDELGRIFSDMGEQLSSHALKIKFSIFDVDGDGHVDFEEFVTGVCDYIRDPTCLAVPGDDGEGGMKGSSTIGSDLDAYEDGGEDNSDGEEDEDDDIPEDIASLPADHQQAAILNRSILWMGGGTLLVLVLSDPMCDVLNEIGVRMEINPFYVAFVLAPLASNASEVIASYSYACKRTVTTMTVSLSALEGAAIMNNTFVFGIFTMLVYSQGLAWRYFAETLAMLVVQCLVGFYALKTCHTLFDGVLILCIFPLSLVFIAWLEAAGWD
jgi:Ca2+/H+ antiporter